MAAYGDSNSVVIVYPDSMRGWTFYDDQRGTACPTGSACQMVAGPATPPLGGGSAELADSLATDGKALILPGYGGTRLDQMSALRYATYRQSDDPGNNLAISLQFNVDYDLTDAAVGYQGRLVYEPYAGSGGNVPRNTWQNWDARAGRWWGSKATVTLGNANVSNPCLQNSPCTWAQVLAAFPNIGVHTVYGAVVLKAGSGWPGFRGNVDSLAIGISGVTTLFDFERISPPIMPASPPDSLPPEYATLTDTVRIPNQYAGPLLRQILFVEFKPGTSIASKQSAIASVNGVVAGGAPDAAPSGGLYVIRVPSDSTGQPLQLALARLRSFPQVDDASVDLVLTDPFVYRKPNFGPGQQAQDWRLDPAQAFGQVTSAWALNAVNAPNAWGCSVGDTVFTKVGVLDTRFRNSASLAPNVWHYTGQDDSLGHGAHVASVVASRGSVGVTSGIMWYAKLDVGLVTRAQYTSRFAGLLFYRQMRHLVWHGSRVLNLSFSDVDSATWRGGDEAAIRGTRAFWGHLAARATQMSPQGVHPLWVLAAGNNGPDLNVHWNALTGIADSLPSETIVVTGGSRNAGALWVDAPDHQGAASYGAIDIVAPADDVPVLLAGDQPGFRTGTSFAAPFVTGAAGLIFSFDPSITAAEARDHLIQGARVGGRVATGAGGTFPYLDAYEALKLAAQRPGAPLCGNRVWTSPVAGVQAQRTPTGQPETIIAPSGEFDPWSFNYINVHHGGKRIELAFSDRYVYGAGGVWAPGTWSPDLISEYSGAFKSSSAYWQDHDDSVTTHFHASLSGQTYALNFRMLARATSVVIRDTTLPNALILASNTSSACIKRQPMLDSTGTPTGSYSCLVSDRFGSWEEANIVPSNVNHALDPQARFAIAAMGVWTHYREVAASWAPCWGQGGNPHPDECRGYAVDSLHTSGLHLWKVDRAGNWEALAVPSIAQDSAEVWGMAINELGTELILEIARYRADHVTGAEHCDMPRHEWIALTGNGVSPGTPRYRRDVPDLQLCWGAYDGAGSGAAIRQLKSARSARSSPHGSMTSRAKP